MSISARGWSAGALKREGALQF